ncbi:MAG: glycosyltransferase [Candidatus Nanopelagicales bacterium]
MSQQLRTLQVIARMNVGGTARYLEALVKGLDQHGVEVQLATGFVQSDELEDACVANLPVVRVPNMGRALDPRTDLKARSELSQIINELKPDVIHSHTFKAGLLSRTLSPEIAHIHTYHGHPFVDPEFSGAKALVIATIERTLAHRTDALASVGERVGRDLVAKGIGSTDKFVSIPPAIEPLELVARESARAELGIPQDAVVVGWLGRMIPVKAPERVVALARALPDVTFVMAGGGPLLDSTREAAPTNLHALGWTSATLVYGASDIALLTSVSEGMPVALIEAQLAGLPVVCTDVGSAGEVVLHERTGFVVPPSELREAVAKLVDDAALRASLGVAARENALARFTPQHLVDAHLALYQQVLDARRAGRRYGHP